MINACLYAVICYILSSFKDCGYKGAQCQSWHAYFFQQSATVKVVIKPGSRCV